MRHDDMIEIYGANVAGKSVGFENYTAGIVAFQNHYDSARVNEDGHCIACLANGKKFEAGEHEGYHTFLVREDMMAEILQNCEFEFTKRKGMGRAQPKDWIKEQVDMGVELWFTLKFYPNYD